MNHNQFVRCVENIQDLSGQEKYEYAVVLGGGLMYSKKDIEYNKKTKKYRVFNYIDETKETLTEKELLKSHIGEAMKKRSLIALID